MWTNDLYSSPNITRVIKSGRMRWAERMIHGGKGKCTQGFCWEKWKRPPRRPWRGWGGINLLLKERENEAIVWSGLIWLEAGISSWLLWIRSGTSGFHKIQGISWIYSEGPCPRSGLWNTKLHLAIVWSRGYIRLMKTKIKILISTFRHRDTEFNRNVSNIFGDKTQ